MPHLDGGAGYAVRVFNTLGVARINLVSLALPDAWDGPGASVWDSAERQLASQTVGDKGRRELLFVAPVPALGYQTFWLKAAPATQVRGATVAQLADGSVRLETDYYRAELDPNRGGTIRSLVAKRLGNRELVDSANSRRFNEIRGFFFKEQCFRSSADAAAKVEIVEAGPVRVRLRVSSQIASNAVTQWITLVQGEPRIDLSVTIDWQGNPGIGADYYQAGGFRREQDRKAFYDERYKLLALFPLNLHRQEVFKDAPFDVTESRLTNTFFETWSEIKNDVILHWVDVRDAAQGVGVALLSDHTTSYAHGADHPLGLTLQYRGVGLWGRDYSVRGPTEVKYALLPHATDRQSAAVWTAGTAWNEPLVALLSPSGVETGAGEKSLLTIDGADWEVPAMRVSAGKILVRLFNPSSDARGRIVRYGAPASKVEMVQLNGQFIKELMVRKGARGGTVFELALPSKGIGTLRITP
jgi:alpha-mannosidase